MPAPYRDVARPPSSRVNSRPRAFITRAASPEEEYAYAETDPGNPAEASLFSGALGQAADAATVAAESLREYGKRAYSWISAVAGDILNIPIGAATGSFPFQAGPVTQAVAGIAESLGGLLPASVARAINVPGTNPDAGWLTTADGTTYRLPISTDTQAGGEKAQSDRAAAALRPPDTKLAETQVMARVKLAELAQKESEFSRGLQIKLRQEARNDEAWTIARDIAESQARAARPSQVSLQNWWATPDVANATTAAPRQILAIGSGVPGGLITGPQRI